MLLSSIVLASQLLVVAGGPQWVGAAKVVYEAVPGMARLLTSEGFTMAGPRFDSEWLDRKSTRVWIRCVPTRTLGGVAKRALPTFEQVRTYEATDSALKKLDAKLDVGRSGLLIVRVPAPGCELFVRLSGAILRPQSFSAGPDSNDWRTRVQPEAIQMAYRVAARCAADFKNPRWFEELQDLGAYMASQGFVPVLMGSERTRARYFAMADWFDHEFDLSIEFGDLAKRSDEIDPRGYPVSHGAAAVIPVTNPELDRIGVKTACFALPDNLSSAFPAKGKVYLVRLRWPWNTRHGEWIGKAEGTEFDPDVLARFNRVVIGLRKLAQR